MLVPMNMEQLTRGIEIMFGQGREMWSVMAQIKLMCLFSGIPIGP